MQYPTELPKPNTTIHLNLLNINNNTNMLSIGTIICKQSFFLIPKNKLNETVGKDFEILFFEQKSNALF